MKKRSVKNNRINEEVLRGLSEIIRTELKDPRIAEFTSILSVDVAADLKTAKVYITVLGDDSALESTIEGLNSSRGYARKLLAKRVNLRNTPELIFISNSSISYGIKMTKLIDEIIESDNKNNDKP